MLEHLEEMDKKETGATLVILAALEVQACLEMMVLWDLQDHLELEEIMAHLEVTVAPVKMEAQELKETVDMMVTPEETELRVPEETLDPLVLLVKMVLPAQDLLDLLEMTDLTDLLAPEDHQAPQVLTESRESRDLLDNLSIHLTVHLVHQDPEVKLVFLDPLEATSN